MSKEPITFEEVPGSRTSQQAVDEPRRERIAYEELQSGDVIQPGDEWQHECGRWKPFASLDGRCVQVRHAQRARRPHNITQLQDERDEALAEVARLTTELWARGPLGDRIASLTEELAQARAGGQQLLRTIAENTDQFAGHTEALVRERDELNAELTRLQSVVNCLYSVPTAGQVQDMLRTWATELDWSAGCFRAVNRDEIDTIQRTLIQVLERIETIAGTDRNHDSPGGRH